jgi:predicted alpha/beta-fold hydrolase
LFILHGFEGSTEVGYVKACLDRAASRGWGALAMTFRSCGAELNRQFRSYNAGDTGDARWALERLRAFTSGPLFGVGFSLGGNVLLRLLAEGAPLSAAAAVSVPFDLQACCGRLDRNLPWPWIYRSRFLRTLKAKARAKAKLFPGKLDLAVLNSIRTLRAFDDSVTAPMYDFADADGYWSWASSGPVVEKIKVPTLLLQAADDPFVPAEAFPSAAVERNPWLHPLMVPHGGHVGFLAKTGFGPGVRLWAEDQAVQFLAHFA